MKFRDVSILVFIGVVLVAGAIGYISKKWLGNDNVVEEAAEEVIEKETGFDVDLSPSSPEK